MPTIRNQKELQKVLNVYLQKALQETQKIVYDVIDSSIKQFYDEYDPVVYSRTGKFLNSLVSTNIIKKENSYTCEVKIDEDYLKYSYPGNPDWAGNVPATGYSVAKWADRQSIAFDGGNHGYTVDAGREDGFWNSAIEELGDIPGLIKIFKENLIKQGLPLK